MSSKKKKFDLKTTNSFLLNYKNEIEKNNAENVALKERLSDLRTTLELNQAVLLEFIARTVGESAEINELVQTAKVLWEENEGLVNEKNALEFKAFKLQETIEDTPTEIREELDTLQKENMRMKQMLIQKDSSIRKQTRVLEKTRANAFFKVVRKEILVTDPTSANLPINNELIYTSLISNQVTQMNQIMRIKADRIEKEVKLLRDELLALKRDKDNKRLEKLNIASSPNKQRNTKQLPSSNTGPLPKNSNDAVQNAKKVLNTFYCGELNNSDSSSSSSLNSNESDSDYCPRVNAKNKKKELEMLKKEYTQLKGETEKNEAKIEKFKVIYKDMKEKIRTMNPIAMTCSDRGMIKSLNETPLSK